MPSAALPCRPLGPGGPPSFLWVLGRPQLLPAYSWHTSCIQEPGFEPCLWLLTQLPVPVHRGGQQVMAQVGGTVTHGGDLGAALSCWLWPCPGSVCAHTHTPYRPHPAPLPILWAFGWSDPADGKSVCQVRTENGILGRLHVAKSRGRQGYHPLGPAGWGSDGLYHSTEAGAGCCREDGRRRGEGVCCGSAGVLGPCRRSGRGGCCSHGAGRPAGSLEMGLQPEQGGHPTGLGNHVCWAVCPSVPCSPGGEAWTFAFF